jgi:hypothetical protein
VLHTGQIMLMLSLYSTLNKKKLYGIPNDLTTLFRLVLTRKGDTGVAQMSNLNEFLVWLQHDLFGLHNAIWVCYTVL